MAESAEHLTDEMIGPVLRGLSAAEAFHADGLAALGPGALYRFSAAGSAETARTGTDTPALALPSGADVDTITTAWSKYVVDNGAAPEMVRLSSGAAWHQSTAAPVIDAVDPDRPLTPNMLASSVAGRVAIVTGAAQGFGLQIARGLASLGAIVAFADMNLDGAEEQAAVLGSPHRAFAVNVTDEDSVAELIAAVTREYGGFDLVVSNAGVLKAGSVKTLALNDFRLVTDVNYIGFFLMTKHSAPILELENRSAARLQAASTGGAAPSTARDTASRDAASPRSVPYLTDIVEINSKSGLVGSNKNAAYAGSKFGGIGLVQSFALELVEQGTKVNAICPGNYLDGPLWSDPERGLFVQYLRAGKVPGATTVAEVRRFYEDKVPMKRGCTGSDVVRALAYVVGQPYETGQAVPVTGGQVMLA